MNVQDHFTVAVSAAGAATAAADALWAEIEAAYSAPGRHYHNRAHLENMLQQLLPVQEQVRSWNVMILALCYHDIVYEALSGNNEADSTALAALRLGAAGLDRDTIDGVCRLILATQHHTAAADDDSNLFTDADLSILGAEAETYRAYAAAVRQEYAAVPEEQYRAGRKAVLQRFLDRDTIFKTPAFRGRLEARARINLREERDTL